jgi:hypothetical protein
VRPSPSAGPSLGLAAALGLALAAAALGGCKKAKEIDCGAAAKAWVELAPAQLDADGDRERSEKAAAVLPALREEMVKRCNDEAWTLEVRRCIATATSGETLERCDPGAARPAAEPAAAPAAPQP